MILAELAKNGKLIFRNWTTLVLIILAPLFLIALVGYAFSSDELHGITIGIIAGEKDIAALENMISDSGNLIAFPTSTDCLKQMRKEALHLCIQINGTLAPQTRASSQVTFFYDNSRKRISLLLLSELKDSFGLTSERISLLSTTEIFTRINELVAYINERAHDIELAKNESLNIRDDLLARKEQLIAFNASFTPRYATFVRINRQTQIYAAALNKSENDLLLSIDSLHSATTALSRSLTLAPRDNTTAIESLNASLSAFARQLEDINKSATQTVSQIKGATLLLNQLEGELATVNQLINDEINRTEDYLVLINKSVHRLEILAEEVQEKITQFERIDPALAQTIAKPITQGFNPLLLELSSIQIAFPTLLVTVVVFISMLFANILTLLELHNKAYIRNILAPVNGLVFTSGIALTNTIIVFVQVIALLLVAQLQFGITILGHLWPLCAIVLALIVMFTCAGMIIAYLSKNTQSSILLTTFAALGFFMLSESLIALEAMPPPAAAAAGYNPLVLGGQLIRQSLFFDNTVLTAQFGQLLAYLLVAMLLLVIVSKRKNRQRF